MFLIIITIINNKNKMIASQQINSTIDKLIEYEEYENINVLNGKIVNGRNYVHIY